MSPGSRLLPLLILTAATLSRAEDLPTITGFKPAGPVATYDSDSLYQVINGAAELYLDYGFQSLRLQEYQGREIQVSVGVYDMGAPINAFGIYRREQPTKGKPLAVGAEALSAAPYQCLMIKARFYVKVDAPRGGLAVALCRQLLEALVRILPGDNRYPEALQLLPSKGRLPSSLGYTRRSYLGVSELSNCLHARYASPQGKKYQVFLVLPESGEAPGEIWKRLAARWAPVGVSPRHRRLPVLVRKIPYRGTVAVVRSEQGVFGVADAGDQPATLEALAQVISQIRTK